MVTLALLSTLYHFIPLYGETILAVNWVVKAKLGENVEFFCVLLRSYAKQDNEEENSGGGE